MLSTLLKEDFVKSMLSSDGNVSTARFVYLLSVFVILGLFIYETWLNKHMDNMNLLAIMGFTTVGFGVNKAYESKQKEENKQGDQQ